VLQVWEIRKAPVVLAFGDPATHVRVSARREVPALRRFVVQQYVIKEIQSDEYVVADRESFKITGYGSLSDATVFDGEELLSFVGTRGLLCGREGSDQGTMRGHTIELCP
jgi:hypothetical protein